QIQSFMVVARGRREPSPPVLSRRGAAVRAIVQDRYGSPETLALSEIPPPVPGPREVLVCVVASSVNPADLFRVLGVPWLGRLFFGLSRPRLPVLGVDV